jgi:hypothetical protein
MDNNNLQSTNSRSIPYQDDKGVTNVSVRCDGKNLFKTDISMIIKAQNISL